MASHYAPEKAVRGTISNRLKKATAEDPAKLDNEIQKPNLQKVDVATLPFDADTLRVGFTLRVLGNLAQPSACNDQAYQAVLGEKIGDYVREHQFHELAARYAENLANGRFLWRNRVGAEEVEVCISRLEQGSVKQRWVFDALSFNLRTFTKPQGALAELSEVIRQGLLGGDFALLKVEAFVRLGAGQEVFPSQELVLDQSGGKEGKRANTSTRWKGSPPCTPRRLAMPFAPSTPYPGQRNSGRLRSNPMARSPAVAPPIASPRRSSTSITCSMAGCSKTTCPQWISSTM